MIESVLLLVGLAALFLHTSFDRRAVILVPLLLTQIWNFALGAVEIEKKRAKYFSNFWNLFDLLRFLLSLVYFGLALSGTPSEATKALFLTLLCLCQGV